MNLLFLTPQLPHPPRQGTAIRNWGLIKSLADRHSLSLLTFADPDEILSPDLQAACRRIETVPPPQRSRGRRFADLFTSPLPDLAHRLFSREFVDRLSRLLDQGGCDALFVEGLELAGPVAGRDLNVRTIFDAHNCETVLQRRAFDSDRGQPRRWPAALYSFVQSGRLARFEAAACRRATHVTCVSGQDAAALQRLAPGLNPIVIPNGIFLADYDPARFPGPDISSPQLVFTGKMDYRPNVDAVTWFAESVFPLVRRARPRAQFVIVGQRPGEAVRRLAARPGVVVTGAVPDTRPYIAGAAVYVAPLRIGGGTRFKLLEAMALMRPIVSTRLGAEGFDVQNAQAVSLAEGTPGFAAAVLAALEDPPRAATMAAAGYRFVQAYDWSRIIPRLETLLAGV